MGYTYKTVEKLHETDVSIITKVKDEVNNRYLVIKEIKGMDHITKLLFDREINALKKLNNSKNIVKMYDYDLIKSDESGLNIGRIFLEHIEGSNLAEISLDLIEYRDKYGIIFQLVDAIETAHSKSIIHRDIKPGNVMIQDYRNAILIDFGLSKIKGLITKGSVANATIFKSNMYTAPEVGYHSENATFQSDIYSLGATIYYLMTGIEPCLPIELPDKVMDTPGINPRLREIIHKSVMHNAGDRYETVTDLKRDLENVIHDLLDISKFVITIPIGVYERAKRKRFIPESTKYNDFINITLNEWFKESYAFIDSKLNGKTNLTQDEVVFFYGNSYKLLCMYNEDTEHFIVSDLVHVAPKLRNTLTSTYLRVYGVLLFYSSSYDVSNIEHKTYELATELVDHRIMYESDENKQNAFNRFFGLWEKYLTKEKEMIETTSKRVNYSSYNIEENNTIELKLIDTDIEDLGFTQETVLIYDSQNGKNKGQRIIPIGNFKDFIFKNNSVYIRLNSSTAIKEGILPSKGTLVEDYRKPLFLVEKESKALWLLRKNECECSENLRDLILGFENPTSIEGFRELDFFDKRLDINQQEAVKKALATSSVCVIQGPPGTGKTSVIREIVNQILKRNSEDFGQKKFRILVVSQSHTAVDNVLEGLKVKDYIPGKITRVGSSEDVLENIWDKYSLEQSHKAWVEQTISKSENRVMELIKAYEIDDEKLPLYIELKDKTNYSELGTDEIQFIKDYEIQHNDPDKTRILNTIIIQKEWINRLRLADDAETRLVENSTIVAGTCTGFNSNPVIKNMSFDYVIVDEAAKASVPELIIPLIKGSRLILVGDHMQLPPVLKDEVIKQCEDVSKKDFEYGLFKHLFEEFPASNRVRLSMQYRMHETIGKMISSVFYDNGIDTGIEASERTHNLECYAGCQIVWVSTSHLPPEVREEKEVEGRTFKNFFESRVIKGILQKIDKDNCSGYEIAIITGYRAQQALLTQSFRSLDLKNLKDVEIDTVDAYQGRDKDIVIFSTVRSNPKNRIGFQRSEKRVNVALSRAQRLIIIVGDHQLFANNLISTNRFPKIIKYIEETSGCKIEYLGG